MSSKVSTAGIRLTEKRGLLDSCPRRFETKEEAELGETKQAQASKTTEQKSAQQPNNN